MAGILPYTQHEDGTFYFLFGRERTNNTACSDRGLWSDFGGSRNKGESLKACAIREGTEELCGFLSKSTIKENITTEIAIKTYKTFLVYLKNYDRYYTLPIYLNAHYDFMTCQPQIKPLIKDPNNGLYEKDQFAWFSLKDIREKREQFRPFYRDVLDLIIQEFE